MKKRRIAFEGTGLRWSYQLFRPWIVVNHYLREVKWFIQRGMYGYADSDVWGLSSYLDTWMPSALRVLKEGHSYPGTEEASSMKKWARILEKMAQGFEASEAIGEFPDVKELPKLLKKQEEGLQLFVKWYGHLWD